MTLKIKMILKEKSNTSWQKCNDHECEDNIETREGDEDARLCV